ncbi:unnamed protein product [Dracunculus medinensis]|uniref:PXA domain-containing protein n=1 Tax=Dracunculus medinensis TaxID=318479 RepID=A0A0N4UJY4_DRAME|nr:unnamed protein product [Dracunculus medinensis]
MTISCKKWQEEERTGLAQNFFVLHDLEELLEQMIDTYVNSWYKSEISSDNTLVNEVRLV